MEGIWEDSLDWKQGEKLELKERKELRLVGSGDGSRYRIGLDRKHGRSMNQNRILDVEVRDWTGMAGCAWTGSTDRNLLWAAQLDVAWTKG